MSTEEAKQVFKEQFGDHEQVVGIGLGHNRIAVRLLSERPEEFPDYIDDVRIDYKVVGKIRPLGL